MNVLYSISRKNCYIVSAGDLQNRYSCQEESGKRMTPGLLIGCHIDTSTGLLSFTVNGQEAANKFQVGSLKMLGVSLSPLTPLPYPSLLPPELRARGLSPLSLPSPLTLSPGGYSYKLYNHFNSSTVRCTLFADRVVNTWNKLSHPGVDFNCFTSFKRTLKCQPY